MEKTDEIIDRLLELLIYALSYKTPIYNHKLANDTMKRFKTIIFNNRNLSTQELKKLLINEWNMKDRTYINLFDVEEISENTKN